MPGRLELRPSKYGPQVFALDKFLEGEIVLDLQGHLRLKHELPGPGALDKYLQVGDYLYLELDELSNGINHSCDPNCAMIVDDAPHVFLAALRLIEPWEEITYDYSLTMVDDDWEAPCHCGSTICREKIREYRHLPPAVQERYRRLGVVPKYVLDRANF